MSRNARTNQYKLGFSERLNQLINVYLQIDVKELSKQMGHASTSTLRNALDGNGAIDIERLYILGKIQTKSGALPNLDWLLTGRGLPLLSQQEPTDDGWFEWLSYERKQALKILAAVPLPQ